jgi:hypothetical protein
MAKGVKGSTPPDEEKPVKTSFAIKPTVMQKLHYIKLFDKKKPEITELVNEGLEYVINKFEKKHGKIPIE